MNDQACRQGQPLIVLAVVLIGWITFRAACWNLAGSLEARPVADAPLDIRFDATGTAVVADSTSHAQGYGAQGGKGAVLPIDGNGWISAPVLDSPPRELLWDNPAAMAEDSAGPHVQPATSRIAASHNLIWMAAMAHIPLPESVRKHVERVRVGKIGVADGSVTSEQTDHGRVQPARFSVNSWLFLRQGGASLGASGNVAPTYGRGQAGAVLRYNLRPGSQLRPHAYVRVTQALDGPTDRDIALGLSTKPVGQVPLALHVEARLSERAGRQELRPAAFLTTGGERENLPLGLSVRGYAQAGYIGGDFATGFADGNLVAEREVARFDLGSIEAGAGVWAGAQKGAARVDLGPTVGVKLRLGEVPARLSVDYRVRVAGDAEPGSGIAMTLSTGF